jgi:hypothetical protein
MVMGSHPVAAASVVGSLFAQIKMTLGMVLSFISDISSIRYNIQLTLMGELATLL